MTQRRWSIFCWGDPLFGVDGGPRYWGMYWAGFQLGYWESPKAWQRRCSKETP